MQGNTLYLPEVEQVVFHTTGALGVGVENEVTVSAIENAVHVFWLWHQVSILHSPYLQTEHRFQENRVKRKAWVGLFRLQPDLKIQVSFRKQ